MLSNVLYSKRFFPYSVSNVLAGLDEDGEGWVYSYDPVGCVEKLKNSSGGAGVAIIQPLLDNQVSNLLRQMSATRSKYTCQSSLLEKDFGCVRVKKNAALGQNIARVRPDFLCFFLLQLIKFLGYFGLVLKKLSCLQNMLELELKNSADCASIL